MLTLEFVSSPSSIFVGSAINTKLLINTVEVHKGKRKDTKELETRYIQITDVKDPFNTESC